MSNNFRLGGATAQPNINLVNIGQFGMPTPQEKLN